MQQQKLKVTKPTCMMLKELRLTLQHRPRTAHWTNLSRNLPSCYTRTPSASFGKRNHERTWLLHSSRLGPNAVFEVQEYCHICWDCFIHRKSIWSAGRIREYAA